MYPHFIEVNSLDLEGEIIVNVESIAYVCGEDEAQIILNVADREDNTINCKESYDELKKLIEDIGCQIHKPDPRLDSHPLTGNDFMNMEKGEPIWNPNHQRWYLFLSYDPVYITVRMRDDDGCTCIVEHEDLYKYPLYRMKVTNE